MSNRFDLALDQLVDASRITQTTRYSALAVLAYAEMIGLDLVEPEAFYDGEGTVDIVWAAEMDSVFLPCAVGSDRSLEWMFKDRCLGEISYWGLKGEEWGFGHDASPWPDWGAYFKRFERAGGTQE